MLKTNIQSIAMRAQVTVNDDDEKIYRKILEKDINYMTFYKR